MFLDDPVARQQQFNERKLAFLRTAKAFVAATAHITSNYRSAYLQAHGGVVPRD